jgi:hypothetical protein
MWDGQVVITNKQTKNKEHRQRTQNKEHSYILEKAQPSKKRE